MSMNEKARALAVELLNEDATNEDFTFDVTGSTDQIVVYVARVKKKRVAKSLTDAFNSISALPRESTCPNCGKPL